MQIEVANHFNEDAFSHGLAEGLAERLRTELRDVRCTEHGKEPTIKLSTDGVAQVLNDIRIEIDGCCDAVISQVQAIVGEIRRDTE